MQPVKLPLHLRKTPMLHWSCQFRAGEDSLHNTRLFLAHVGGSLVIHGQANVIQGAANRNELSTVMQQLIDNLAQQIQTKERFTAVGISIGHRNNPVKVAVSGLRQHQSSIPVQSTDKWHVGSITKSITATVIGKLIEDGVLEFDSMLSDLLPNLSMHAQWAECSLEHLLTHTSGLPANFPWKA